MYITDLSIRNFRKIEKASVVLDAHMNVIFGAGGSGKTSFLDAAAVAAGSFLIGLDECRDQHIKPEDARQFIDPAGRTHVCYPVVISADGCADDRRISWSRQLVGHEKRTKRTAASSMIAVSKSYQDRLRQGDAKLILPVIAYYGTERHWTLDESSFAFKGMQSHRQNGYINWRIAGMNEDLMLSWLQTMKIQEFQTNKQSKALKSVERAVSNNRRRVDDVNISGLFSDIACRSAVLNPQLKDPVKQTPGIVMIDDIEKYLNPQEQKIILRLLASTFPAMQFIVATESPLIAESSAGGKVIRLK